ncbi:GIY-YIG nuclease family protein [bacterium]|nr:GIY-YIG nuclease family protein [bacterium]MBU1064175.1 GIY-YIG nuclease family protein [bacterium]MBU1635452.1 GIY-YIG nuclease family protein [bacterium]
MYKIYVLKNLTDNFHYIGHTKDIEKRLHEHNYGKVRSTKAHIPFEVIYTEEFKTKSEAQQRKYYLKRGKGNVCLREMLKSQNLW